MKAHVGVDASSGLVHTAGVTSGNVHDTKVMDRLIRDDDTEVYGDKGYASDAKKRAAEAAGVLWAVKDYPPAEVAVLRRMAVFHSCFRPDLHERGGRSGFGEHVSPPSRHRNSHRRRFFLAPQCSGPLLRPHLCRGSSQFARLLRRLRLHRCFARGSFHHPLARHLQQHLTIFGVILRLAVRTQSLVFVELGL
jgi:hypothetical protein